MKKYYLIALAIMFLTIFLPAILLFGIKEFAYDPQPSLDATQRIFGNVLVSQIFISKEDNFSSIGLSIKNPNLQNREDLILILYENGSEQRRVIISGKNIGDGNFVKFNFAPIETSKNKKYTFILSAPSVFENQSLEVFYKGSASSGFSMMINDNNIDGSISFVSFYKPKNIFFLIEKVYLNWTGKIIADKLFFVVYTIIILSLSGYLIGFKIPEFRRN